MIKPLGDNILVEKIEVEKKTKSGIILSDTTTSEDLIKAKVIAISQNITEVKEDDVVYFSKFKGENIRFEEVNYIILNKKDVLAKE